MQKQLILRYNLNLNFDVIEKINFSQLMNKVMKMIKTTKKFKKIQNTNKRDDKLSELIKQYDENESLVLKSKNSYRLKSNYIKIMSMNKKRKTKQSRRMNEMIKQFETMILTMRVIASIATSIFRNVSSNSFNANNRFYFFKFRLIFDQCMYCEFIEHSKKKNCEIFLMNVRFERIHFN